MSKNIKYRQFISNGINHIFIMPLYGTTAFEKRKELNLPMRIDREPRESKHHFDDRVNSQHFKISKKLDHIPYSQTWIKIVMAKPTIVDHEYVN